PSRSRLNIGRRPYRRLLAAGVLAVACSRPPGEPVIALHESLVWQLPDVVDAAPAATDSVVYFGVEPHTLLAVVSATGTTRWRASTPRTTGSPAGRNILVVGRTVVYADWGLFGFDAQSGTPRWSVVPSD